MTPTIHVAGMKMQGYNGSQSWDTSFAMQALAAAGPKFAIKHNDTISRIHSYLDATQIKNDVPMRERFYRTISKGGWPFSTNGMGQPFEWINCARGFVRCIIHLQTTVGLSLIVQQRE